MAAVWGSTISRCWTATALPRHVASEVYLGGMLDRSGGHMHPLNLALGQAAALEGLGGVIHEESPVGGHRGRGGAAGGADGARACCGRRR